MTAWPTENDRNKATSDGSRISLIELEDIIAYSAVTTVTEEIFFLKKGVLLRSFQGAKKNDNKGGNRTKKIVVVNVLQTEQQPM